MVASAPEPLLVLTTAPDPETAAALARGLVESRLAACVNVLPPMTSVYIWEDRLHEDGEQQLLIKTRRDRLAELAAWLRERHPYELPELIAVPIVDGLPDYLTWLSERTAP